jgi:hypothetical protein
MQKRSIADKVAQSAQYLRLTEPLASRRSAVALAPATERRGSVQAALHAKHNAKAFYLCFESRLSEAPRTSVATPRGTALCIGANCVHLFAMPELPGSGVTSAARRNCVRSINSLSTVDVLGVARRRAEPITKLRIYNDLLLFSTLSASTYTFAPRSRNFFDICAIPCSASSLDTLACAKAPAGASG